MNRQIATRPNRFTIRWTEDGEGFSAENGKDRLEVFPSPFRANKYGWRRLRMSSGMFWKPKDGGVAESIEAAMTTAGVALGRRC